MAYTYDLGVENGDYIDLTDLHLDCIAVHIFCEFQKNNKAFEDTLNRAIRMAINTHNDETDPAALFLRAEDSKQKRRMECRLSFAYHEDEDETYIQYHVKGNYMDGAKGITARGDLLYVENLPASVISVLTNEGAGKKLDDLIETNLYSDRIIRSIEQMEKATKIYLEPGEMRLWTDVEAKFESEGKV